MKFAEPSKLNRNPGGWGTRLFVVLPAVPNTNRGLIDNLLTESRDVRDQPESGLQARKIENEHGHACEQKPGENFIARGSSHLSEQVYSRGLRPVVRDPGRSHPPDALRPS